MKKYLKKIVSASESIMEFNALKGINIGKIWIVANKKKSSIEIEIYRLLGEMTYTIYDKPFDSFFKFNTKSTVNIDDVVNLFEQKNIKDSDIAYIVSESRCKLNSSLFGLEVTYIKIINPENLILKLYDFNKIYVSDPDQFIVGFELDSPLLTKKILTNDVVMVKYGRELKHHMNDVKRTISWYENIDQTLKNTLKEELQDTN